MVLGMAKKRQPIDDLIDAHVALRRKAKRARARRHFILHVGSLPNRPQDAITVGITFPQHARSRAMNFDTSSRVRIFAVPHVPLSGNATKIARRTFGVTRMRSVANIRLWRSYLPQDCVNKMIEMGWDRTT
jgi:hypothetical protein